MFSTEASERGVKVARTSASAASHTEAGRAAAAPWLLPCTDLIPRNNRKAHGASERCVPANPFDPATPRAGLARRGPRLCCWSSVIGGNWTPTCGGGPAPQHTSDLGRAETHDDARGRAQTSGSSTPSRPSPVQHTDIEQCFWPQANGLTSLRLQTFEGRERHRHPWTPRLGPESSAAATHTPRRIAT